MLIASSEGQGWCYEVIVQSDGFLVQARDLDSGEIALDETTLFRTSPAALAYADMVAAADRFAAARLDDEEEWEDLADAFIRNSTASLPFARASSTRVWAANFSIAAETVRCV